MPLRKIIICFIFLTVVSLCYVYQQTRIVELGYEIRGKEEQLSQLLDCNKILIYNVNALSSPLNLDEKLLSRRRDLSVVDSYRTLRLASVKGNSDNLIIKRSLLSSLFDIFVPKAQAEASTIRSNSR